MNRSLEQQLQALFARPDYQPMNKSELARALGVAPKDRAALRAAIRELEDRGALTRLKKGRYSTKAPSDNTLVGSIRFHPRGHAFFIPDPAADQNRRAGVDLEKHARIFVPARNTTTALHGDRVVIRVHKAAPPKWHRHVKRKRAQMERLGEEAFSLEGRVLRVLERGRMSSSIIGTCQKRGKFRYCTPQSKVLPQTIELNPSPLDSEAAHGDVILVALDDWPSPDQFPRGHIAEVLGPPDTPGVDILAIIHKHQLPVEFPEDVLVAAGAIAEDIPAAELESREDWRDRDVFTIDPVDARDFDDAICVTPLDAGGWELAVHIADVSHYVEPGEPLDREARRRGNSVYLVDRVLPMLPEKLSNGICSLKAGVERLTRAVIMIFDADGNQTSSRFAATVIRSQARLTYEQAFALLKPHLEGRALSRPPRAGGSGSREAAVMTEHDPPSSHSAFSSHLHHAWDLAARLRENRFAKGGLDLDMPEVKVVLDENGKPVDLLRVEYDESHQLIEEFMLAANEAVALIIKNRMQPSVYRVHEDPDAAKLYEFRELARMHQYQIGDLTNRDELQKLLEMIKGQPEERLIKVALLKSLKRAVYHADPLGHYGLAKENYTHFTSPIRRYADLIVHRVLGNIMSETPSAEEAAVPAKVEVPSYSDLVEIARHISDTERAAADAEVESNRLKQLEYFATLAREQSGRTFTALVLEVARLGLFVELEDYFIRGLVKQQDLPSNSDWYFDLHRQRAVGRLPKMEIHSGDRVEVEVANVDFERKFIDFAIVGVSPA